MLASVRAGKPEAHPAGFGAVHPIAEGGMRFAFPPYSGYLG